MNKSLSREAGQSGGAEGSGDGRLPGGAELSGEAVLRREALLDQVGRTDAFDVVVIGGGASGLGIALEAVLRGYRTLLMEQADFSKGTSSRSTKLVHGGVRYLEQGDIGMVRKANIERGLLSRNAPHLVKNQTFLIPLYGYWDRLKYVAGLKFYDWIAGKWSLGPSLFVSRKKTLEYLPGIKAKGLIGGVMYHDGQFDDSRLAINLMQSIQERGGIAINYIRVKGLLKEEGQIAGVIAEDIESGQSYRVRSRVVINATGVFADGILKMDDAGSPKSICVSQGVHLVLDRKFYPSDHALMIPHTSDGRVLFAIPWHNKVVVGTTDTPVEQATLEPKALEKEINFILGTAGQYLTLQPQRSDVLSVFAGLRPLAAPKEGGRKTKEISRSHKILVSRSHLFSIIGGKWTTYRKMGEEMIDRVEKELGWSPTPSVSDSFPVHGFVRQLADGNPFDFYGSDAVYLKEAADKDVDGWIDRSIGLHRAQVIWAIRKELARSVEDVLARRTRVLFTDARRAMEVAPAVAAVMAGELGQDATWQKRQIADFVRVAYNYLLEPNRPE